MFSVSNTSKKPQSRRAPFALGYLNYNMFWGRHLIRWQPSSCTSQKMGDNWFLIWKVVSVLVCIWDVVKKWARLCWGVRKECGAATWGTWTHTHTGLLIMPGGAKKIIWSKGPSEPMGSDPAPGSYCYMFTRQEVKQCRPRRLGKFEAREKTPRNVWCQDMRVASDCGVRANVASGWGCVRKCELVRDRNAASECGFRINLNVLPRMRFLKSFN